MNSGTRLMDGILGLQEEFHHPFKGVLDVTERYKMIIDEQDILVLESSLTQIISGINDLSSKINMIHHNQVPKNIGTQTNAIMTPSDEANARQMFKRLCDKSSKNVKIKRIHRIKKRLLNKKYKEYLESKAGDDNVPILPAEMVVSEVTRPPQKTQTRREKKDLSDYAKKFIELKMSVTDADVDKMMKILNEFKARCPKCHKEFLKESLFVHHAPCHFKISKSIKEHTCPVCQLKGPTKRIRSHIPFHFPANIECLICNMKFRDKLKAKYHIQLKHSDDERPVKCLWPGCQKDFTDKSHAISHVIQYHMKKNAFICGTCHRQFSSSKRLMFHEKRVHVSSEEKSEVRFKCPHPPCLKYFSKREMQTTLNHLKCVETHMRERHSDVPFDLKEFYAKNFDAKICPSVKKMIKRKIDTSGSKPILVPVDDDENTDVDATATPDVPEEATAGDKTSEKSEYSFETNEEMEAYAAQFVKRQVQIKWQDYQHMWKFKPFSGSCAMCQKEFQSKHDLLVHLPCYRTKMGITGTINKDNPIPCSVCSRGFGSMWQLKCHMTFHLDPQYECLLCTHKSHNSTTALRHAIHHAGDHPVSCLWEGCTKKFDALTVGVSHVIRTHLKLIKYKCDICGETWANRRSLFQHKKRAHCEKSYKCLVDGCEKRFYCNRQRKDHIKSKHPEFKLDQKDVQEQIKDELKRTRVLTANGVSGIIEVVNGTPIVLKKPVVQRGVRKLDPNRTSERTKKAKKLKRAPCVTTTVEVADDTDDTTTETSAAVESIDAHVVPQHHFESTPAPTFQDMYNPYDISVQQYHHPFNPNIDVNPTTHYMTHVNPPDYASGVNTTGYYNLRRSSPRTLHR